MKYIKLELVICAMLAFFTMMLEAQTTMKIDIKAIVHSSEGEPLAGVAVNCESEKTSTITDSVGAFTLNVSLNTMLTISAKGFESKTIIATPDLGEVVLTPVAQFVQIAYRKVKKDDLLGNVSFVNIPDIQDVNYTTYSLDGMEAFIGGFNGNSIWGMGGYLVLIDGVPRDATMVLPSEIEQITFLKGVGSLALYGSRATNGVIYISTKKGKIGSQRVSVRANTGQYVPKSTPNYLGSAEYMTMYNEARTNDGLSELYNEETIYNHSSGVNPYRYPDVDYYSSDYLKNTYNRTDVTTEISGGNERARYYTNAGYYGAGSLLDFGEAVHNRTERFNIRGNVDVDLNDFISCTVDATAIFYNGKSANGNFWNGAATMRPDRFAPLIPISMLEKGNKDAWNMVNNSNHVIDGQYILGGNQLNLTNPIADTYAGGTNKYTSRQFQFNTGVDVDLRNLLKGLTFNTTLGVDYTTSYSQSFNNNYSVYEVVDTAWHTYASSDSIGIPTPRGYDTNTGIQNINNSWYKQTIAFSGQLNYRTSVNDIHHISSMLIAQGYQQSESGIYHKVNNTNLGIQAGYDFANRYYFDFSGAIVYSSKLAEGNRVAFSPTVSLGWRISQENFLKGSSVVDNLKLTVSGGILYTDLDISDYYLYEAILKQTDGAWYTWRDGSLAQSTDARRGENLGLTLPKREEVNVGIEASLFKNFLTIDGSLFANRITGNIVQSSVLYPSYFSTGWPNTSFIPYANYNEDQRMGFDFNVNINKRIGNTDLTLGVSGIYQESKATQRAENYEDSYQNRQGKPIDALWGLQNEGFFMNVDDIANAPSQAFGEVKPGDIKYKDQNDDGVINTQDEVYLGRGGWSGAPFTMGVNLTARWKSLTLFALGTGRYGAYAFKSNSYYWVDGEDKYSEVVRDRWTVDTQNTAKYPRLTTLNSDNNFRNSDFWLYKTNRFDLAKVQITYNLPKSLIQKTFLQGLDIYASGFNLFTISPEKKTLELNVGSAPQTRFYNLGIKAIF